MLTEAAKNAGIKGHTPAGFSGIGGSRVIQHWNLEDEKHQAKTALSSGTVDVLTLSPIWMPDEGIEKFAKLGFEHNPNIRVTVQEFWLPNDTYEPKYPLDVHKIPKVDHDVTDLAELRKKQSQYDHDVDEYVRCINERLGKQVIFTVPVGQAAVALREKIVAGQTPGLKKQWDLFSDNRDHAAAAAASAGDVLSFRRDLPPQPDGLARARRPEEGQESRVRQAEPPARRTGLGGGGSPSHERSHSRKITTGGAVGRRMPAARLSRRPFPDPSRSPLRRFPP